MIKRWFVAKCKTCDDEVWRKTLTRVPEPVWCHGLRMEFKDAGPALAPTDTAPDSLKTDALVMMANNLERIYWLLERRIG